MVSQLKADFTNFSNLVIVSFLLNSVTFAEIQNKEIYRCEDKLNGSVLYTDNPQGNMNCVKKNLELIQTSQTPSKDHQAGTHLNQEHDKDKTTNQEYTAFEVILPADTANGINGGGGKLSLPVSLRIEPSLSQDDKVQVLFDGAPNEQPSTNTSVTIEKEGLDPGTHSVSAQIIRNNQVIKTANAVEFTFMRNHIPTPATQANAPPTTVNLTGTTDTQTKSTSSTR